MINSDGIDKVKLNQVQDKLSKLLQDFQVFQNVVQQKVFGNSNASIYNPLGNQAQNFTGVKLTLVDSATHPVFVLDPSQAAFFAPTATAGAAALPAAPVGFIEFTKNGTVFKIPYYNT
jgi:hypothetical protein